MAVYPPLCVHNVAQAGPGAAHGETELGECFNYRFDVVLVRGQHLRVVPAGEPHMPIAILISYVAEVPDEVRAYKLGRSRPDGVQLIPGLGYMSENPGLQYLVVFPLTVVLCHHLGKHFLIIGGANIGFGHNCLPPLNCPGLSFKGLGQLSWHGPLHSLVPEEIGICPGVRYHLRTGLYIKHF